MEGNANKIPLNGSTEHCYKCHGEHQSGVSYVCFYKDRETCLVCKNNTITQQDLLQNRYKFCPHCGQQL